MLESSALLVRHMMTVEYSTLMDVHLAARLACRYGAGMSLPIKIGLGFVAAIGVVTLLAIVVDRCTTPQPTAAPTSTASAAPFKYKGLPPEPTRTGRQVITPPPEGELGYLFYPDKNVLPVFPVLGDYKEFTAAVARGESGDAQIMRGKLVPVRTMVKVLRYTGQGWVKLRVEEGRFVGVEGYTFGNVILSRTPPE